jgi:hypothetical protein
MRDGDGRDEELPVPPPPRIAVTLPWLLAAILAGGAVGFFIGDRPRRSPAPVTVTVTASAPHPSTASAPFASLGTTGNKCSAQVGARRLQLGIEIRNEGNTEVELRSVTPVFPLHGLQAVATRQGTCGQPSISEIAGVAIEPQSTVWITTTVRVVDSGCPAALPVLFDVTYTGAGLQRRSHLAGFNDLTDVPYTGCER